MKKRILSILLTLCMMLCLTPISVFAEEVGAWGSAAIKLGADALNKTVNTEIAPTVYFGQNHENNPAAWRVIGYDGNGVTSAQGDITLFAAYNMGWSKFGSSAAYADSDLKTAIDALAEKLTSKETDAVQKQTLASGSYNRENTDCVAGTQVDNAVFWPLSTAEASAVNNDLRIADREHQYWASSYWWLRSPGAKNRDVASVDGFANIDHDGIDISNMWGVRPTFKLNLNSVLFASAAVGGKPDGGLTEVPEYSGSEWKLTLLDSSRSFAVTEKTADAAPDDTVTLNYSGATTGANEYISVIIADNNGAQYYGRVAQPTAESGTVEIKIPSDIAPGDYTMKVFSEQYNGDRKTDLASAFADVTLTVESQPDEQFTLTPGGRYYFDLSAMDIPGTVNSNLPDSTLHYVPFTYVGTVDAYSLKNEADKDTTPYEHSLFIADYNVKCSLQRETLVEMNLIYGQTYTASNVNYTLRAPSVGDHHRNEGEGSGLAPIDNEWDTIYQKSADYIKNWYKMRSFGQDIGTGNVEGWYLSRGGHFAAQVTFWARPTLPERDTGFRPVLEVMNPDTLGSDGLKAVTLDLGGGKLGNSSEDIQIIVKNGSTFTAPASDGLTRPDGNTDSYFMWLDGNGNSYEPGGSVPADVTELTVQWTAPTYAVTLNTNGGTIADGKDVTGYTYGVGATLPTDVTRTGYTFKGWYDNENLTGSPVTAIGGAETGNKEYWAKWEINQYTITFDTNGGSEIAPITQDYGTEITVPADPTRKGYTFKGWDKEIPETMPAENITITARWKDTEKPTGEIIIGTNKWNKFLNELTFGIFFKDTQEVTINAVDNSGVVFVSYLVTDKELSEAELNSLVFRAYEEPFCIDPNGEYIVYVMLVDENINITYLRSDRITLDNIQPVISGIENGKTYCEAQTVTVDEKYVDTVTVNGTAVTLDADGGFVLPPTNGEQKIVVTDKSGNNAEMTVTVNNGHTFGEWVSDNDGKHTRKCTVDGCDAFETENCSGGNATCTEKAVCDVCGKAYGEFDGTNHEGGVQEWTTRTAFNHEQKWNCCGAVIVASEAHEWKDGVCRECGYVCLHNDADKDHVCDYCKKTISEHEDKDKNHICDYCEKTISEHEDKDKDHICDYCKKTISAHEDATPEEIKKPDTVTAKPDDSKSPQTGDNSNLILWIALLIISGGVMKGVTAFGKSKKHSAKIKDK